MEIYFDKNGNEHPKPDDVSPKWRVSGCALITSEEGKILMIQPAWSDKWELPGGGIEMDESIKEGVIRECYEETGYDVEVGDQLISSVGERKFYSTAESTFFKAVILFYSGKIRNTTQNLEAINPKEIALVEWINPEILNESNVKDIFWPAVSAFLSKK